MSSPGQQMFNLRWNNFQSSISSALHEQLLGEELVDVTLSAEGRTVGAHRVVLSACSPYFKQLFKTLPSQQHPVIVIRDCKFADIQTLLAFIYQGEVQVSNSALPSLLKTAEVLSIKGLTPSHLREEQPSPPDSMAGWGEAYSPPPPPPPPPQPPTPRARPQTGDESPPKRIKTEVKREAPAAASAESAEPPAATPLNLSCAPAAPPPPPPQSLPLPAGRFTLKIPTVLGAVPITDDNGTAGSPQRLESDDGSWPDWDLKESRSKPTSPPSVSANVSPPDTSSAEGGPVWKSLLPKPNRRMLPVKCPECSKLISNAYNLRVHMDLHKHLTYICSICSTPTRSRDTLRKHITNIHKVKGEALREMLDHGIVSSETPSEPVKPTAAEDSKDGKDNKDNKDDKDDKEAALVVDESGGQPSPAAAEPPLPASASTAGGTAAAVTTC